MHGQQNVKKNSTLLKLAFCAYFNYIQLPNFKVTLLHAGGQNFARMFQGPPLHFAVAHLNTHFSQQF